MGVYAVVNRITLIPYWGQHLVYGYAHEDNYDRRNQHQQHQDKVVGCIVAYMAHHIYYDTVGIFVDTPTPTQRQWPVAMYEIYGQRRFCKPVDRLAMERHLRECQKEYYGINQQQGRTIRKAQMPYYLANYVLCRGRISDYQRHVEQDESCYQLFDAYVVKSLHMAVQGASDKVEEDEIDGVFPIAQRHVSTDSTNID